MRKERKVLFEKVNELERQWDEELDRLGIALYNAVQDKYLEYIDEVNTKLANTYNISLEEYKDMEHKMWMRKHGINEANLVPKKSVKKWIGYRCEYFEEKIDRWVCFIETKDLDEAKSLLDHPIIGNPPTRVAKYEKTGVRKIKYKVLEVIEVKNHK
nr:hypothetical protein [uncultured Lachnoanaerobaculum sp.]